MTCQLHLGDCLAANGLPALGDASVDHVITDPPFDARAHRAALEVPRAVGRKVGGALPFAALPEHALAILAGHFARVARRWILVFCAERQRAVGARARGRRRFVRVGLALRTNPRPQMSGDRPGPPCDHIVIAHAGAGPMRWNGGGKAASWPAPAARFDPGGQRHPTQKPLALMRGLVEDFADAGDLVLDPFAGAGTTAVACKELGRGFLGWELSPEYQRTALARLEATREQLRLAPADVEQLSLGAVTS